MKGELKIKVRGYHLDLFSHVNNARYLEFLEEARWTCFDDLNIQAEDFARRGLSITVVNINISYKKSAGFGDTLRIVTSTKEIRNRSAVISQVIYLDDTDTVLADAEITIVYVDIKTGKAVAINDDIAENLLGIVSETV